MASMYLQNLIKESREVCKRNMDMDSHVHQDLDLKINLLNNSNQNKEFLNQLKNVIEYHNSFDLATTEKRVLKNVLPEINNRFNRVYNDNLSLFETLDDEIIYTLVKENLEVAFELTEALQKILNFYQQNPFHVADIESVLQYVPNCVLLFTNHWKSSSETYKNAFNAEISKLLEVIKHLYVSFLHILEFSVSIHDNDNLGVLVKALTFICDLPKTLYDLDANSMVSSWKCFGAVTAKYSAALETCMDLRLPINALCDDIYKVLKTPFNNDMEAFRHQIKMLTFLIKILSKITDIFYQQLDTFALDLLIFYVKILSLSPGHFKFQQYPAEALLALDTGVFNDLGVFLHHLVMGQSGFKNHLEKISDYMDNMVVFKEHPLGLIRFLSKILHMVATNSSDWFLITIKFIDMIFITLPHCYTELFMDGYDGGVYQQLIVNMSAAILLQDSRFQSAEILLRHILHDDVFVALLALEIYSLVVSNVPPEECATLLINLLYGINDLRCGFFTSRPEMVFLKILLRRIFEILPITLKDVLIKLFSPDQCMQIWRFLGLNSLPAHQVQLIINPVIENTSECMTSILDNCSEDLPLNIAEGLCLLSTVNNLDTNDQRFSGVIKFLDAFWASDFNSEAILDNNLMTYFILGITGVTSSCIQNSILDLKVISTKLKTLSCKESYWVPVYKLVYSILNSLPILNIPEINKQRILTHIAEIINLPVQNKSNLLMQEMYLELFKNLNESQKNILNFLLDNLNHDIAHQIFLYLEKCSTTDPLITVHKHNIILFKHTCLNWKSSINTNQFTQPKRAKMEIPQTNSVKTLNSIENVRTSHILNKIRKINNSENTKERTRDFGRFIPHEAEDDSSAAEVIERIKGEVKCLIKICKTDRLTQKNVADLRILMSQVTSLM